MDELKRAVARIEENLRLLREDFAPLLKTVQSHSEEITILKNDKRWTKGLFTMLMGVLGVIIGALAEYFRK